MRPPSLTTVARTRPLVFNASIMKHRLQSILISEMLPKSLSNLSHQTTRGQTPPSVLFVHGGTTLFLAFTRSMLVSRCSAGIISSSKPILHTIFFMRAPQTPPYQHMRASMEPPTTLLPILLLLLVLMLSYTSLLPSAAHGLPTELMVSISAQSSTITDVIESTFTQRKAFVYQTLWHGSLLSFACLVPALMILFMLLFTTSLLHCRPI